MDISIRILIPCFNEELTVGKVITDFRTKVPDAKVYIFDNNSTDRTAEIAKSLGADVIKEKRQGKGYVVQSMFKKIDADIYVMVDGDDTYDLSEVNRMISMVINDETDMVVGNRHANYSEKSFRPFHTFGNELVKNMINKLFRTRLKDIMSGFRVMNRAFVKNVNIMASGFEVETEMTIKALKYGYVIKELDVNYKERPTGSYSKLSTFKDGIRVMKTIFNIFKDYRPLLFFSIISFLFLLISLLSGFVVVNEFIETRYIRHVPLTIFASGTMVLSIISFVTGVILDSINRRFDELHSYLRRNR